jgi:hypothetical protein
MSINGRGGSKGRRQRQPQIRRPLRHQHVHLCQWQICRPLCQRQTRRLLICSIRLSSSPRTSAPPLGKGTALAIPGASINPPAAMPPKQTSKLRRLMSFICVASEFAPGESLQRILPVKIRSHETLTVHDNSPTEAAPKQSIQKIESCLLLLGGLPLCNTPEPRQSLRGILVTGLVTGFRNNCCRALNWNRKAENCPKAHSAASTISATATVRL